MRIALFTETYLPYLNGVVTHVKILKEGLEELGHDVLVVTADAGTRRHYIKDGVLHCPAAHIKQLYDYSVSQPISHRRLRLLHDFNPDIIHIHNEFGIGLFGVRAARILHVPLVHTLHTMYDDYIYYIAPKPLTNITKRVSHTYARYIADRAQALTSPSSKSIHYYKLAGVDKPVHIIPNSVETDIFSPTAATDEAKADLRARYGIPIEATVAVFVGRIGQEKSIDVLLEYWQQQCSDDKNLFLMIIGDGPFLGEYEALAHTLKLKNVVFTGRVPHDELPPYLCMGDAYVSASTSEMHSISMLEGMASGLPVLQRMDPDNKDQIERGVNGYIFETPEEMGDQLRELAAMNSGEKMMLKKSVAASVANRNSTEIAQFMLDVYAKATQELKREDELAEKALAEQIKYGAYGYNPLLESPDDEDLVNYISE